MKLLVLSDTHGKLTYAHFAVSRLKDRISGVIHLGDMVNDAKALEEAYGLPFYYVAGNCDFYFSAEEGLTPKKIVEAGGVRLFLTHGHLEGVKNGYSRLAETAEKNGCAAALCGHTHEPFNKTIGNTLILNPGSAAFPRRGARFPSYGVLDVSEDGSVAAGIVEIRG